MSYLWSLDDFLAATNGRPVGDLPEGISGISIDSRTLKRGEAFFAIKGDNFDGHDFIGQAAGAGAAIAVVSEDRLVALGRWNLPLIVVSDVLEAMVLLGRASRARGRAQIIAITGSVGKTSAKEMLRTVLSACGSVHASVASFNNHWGVPLTLARMPEDVRFAIFEIGMNHPGEITPLVGMVRPHVVMITNVAPAHLGGFESVDEIAKAKAEIFSAVVPGGYAVINRDNSYHDRLEEMARDVGIEHIHTFGTKKGADFCLRSVRYLPDRSEIKAVIKDDEVSFSLNVPGKHMVSNALAVLGAATLLGADLKTSAAAMSNVTAEKGRGKRYLIESKDGPITIIDETYNANPASMEAGLSLLGASEPGTAGRRIAVLGDMLELGTSSAKLHKGLQKPIKAAKADLVFLAGPEMRALKNILDPECIAGHFETASEMETELLKTLRGGDVVMLKASNGLKFAPLIEKIVEAFTKKASA